MDNESEFKAKSLLNLTKKENIKQAKSSKKLN